MTTTHTYIPANEARDFMPTELSYAQEQGQTVLGVIQQHTDDIDTGAAEEAAKKHFGVKATLGEGEDIEDGAQWLVIES